MTAVRVPSPLVADPACPPLRRIPLTDRPDGALLDYGERPGATTVLFLPGTMLGPLQYRVFLRALYARGFSVAALHFRGHGAARHVWRLRLHDLLDDAALAARRLHALGSGPLVLCGHSQGGILTLALACGGSCPRDHDAPAAFAPLPGIAAFFAVCAVFPQHEELLPLTHFAPFAARRSALARAATGLARRLPALPIPLPCYLSPRRLLSGMQRPDLPLAGRRLSYPLALLTDLLRLNIAESTSRPFFLLGARDDALFRPALLERTIERLAAPRKELYLVPSGGHMLLMQPEPARACAAFLARRCPVPDLPQRAHPLAKD